MYKPSPFKDLNTRITDDPRNYYYLKCQYHCRILGPSDPWLGISYKFGSGSSHPVTFGTALQALGDGLGAE